MVRIRIAPSPTGFPHIGTIYQALFDYAFARKHTGKFIVRIEDTDRARLVEGAEDKIYSSLDWFGLVEDESPRKNGPFAPYRQSERLDIYKKYAMQLVETGHAYYCFCTKERLDEVRKQQQAEKKVPMYDKHCRNMPNEQIKSKITNGQPWVIRLKVPENTKIVTQDLIRGEIVFDSNLVDDQVLLKSDGYPTYHLAVVIDDHLMEISHVVRGEEWIPSSPKHVLLYQFLEWSIPIFFHTPVIRNPDKSKFSKRHGHTNVSWYQEQGYLPEAILNYLALMGWSHPDEKDIFSLEEFIKVFDLKDVKPVGPVFDLKKLEWMNGDYIRRTDDGVLKDKILKFYNDQLPADLVGKTIPLIKERIHKLADYQPLCQFFFTRPTEYEVDVTVKVDLLTKVADALEGVTEWQAAKIGEKLLATAQELGIKNSEFFMVLRVAITGKKISPPLNESMELIGKDESLARLRLQH